MSAASLRPSFYSPSGAVPVAAWILLAAVLVPLAFASGLVYCAAVVFIPAVKLRWIASLGLGWVLGSLAARVCRLGKVRSALFTLFAAGLAVAAAYYAAWGIHRTFHQAAHLGVPVRFNAALLRGFLPTEIARWMLVQIRNGGGGIGGFPLVGVWLVELGAILYFTRTTFLAARDERPFCEPCDRWTIGPEEVANLPVSAADPAWERVKELGPEAIRKLQLSNDVHERVVLSVHRCPDCERSTYLNAAGGGWHSDENGETSYQETTVLQGMAVTPRQVEELRALSTELEEAYRELSADSPEADEATGPAVYSDSAASSP